LSIESWEETGQSTAGHSGAPPEQTPFRFYPTSIVEAELRGEFRDVVAVFVDLARPTDERHEVEMAHVLSCLSRHRGYLNHVIKPDADSEGIRVFALWGAPISREHDVGYALRFLDDLRTAVGIENVRAGVTRSTAFTGFIGGPLQEQYTAIGPGVNLASRICTAAGWGEIRVDENIVSRLSDPWVCENVGEIDYRGFTQPVPTHRVVHIPPVLIADSARGDFIGRGPELDHLEDLVAPLWSGRNPGVIAVIGEPGIGKSRIVSALEDRLSHRGPAPLWIHAQADEIRTQPLATLRDALAGYFGRPGSHESGHRLDEYLGQLTTEAPARADELKQTRIALGDLLDLAPDVDRAAALDPKARFENLVIAVVNMIRAMERTAPSSR
jgi:class 3 adenylate cyclase